MIQGKAWYKTSGAQVVSGSLGIILSVCVIFNDLRRRQFAVFQDGAQHIFLLSQPQGKRFTLLVFKRYR